MIYIGLADDYVSVGTLMVFALLRLFVYSLLFTMHQVYSSERFVKPLNGDENDKNRIRTRQKQRY